MLPDNAGRRHLADWLRWQESLHPKAIDLGLERVALVAGRLGLPDLPPATLTIAGTNGKGSSAHLAALIYRHAGYRVGLYTSPHLLRYNERVRIDGIEATDDALCRAFEAIDQARGEVALTYFEFGTLAALWLFREAAVDLQILEVGLGGRLDAVNIVDADVALLTNIGLDHMDWLGPDRNAIGHEKAGIFRAGRPAIIGDIDPPERVLADAREIGADLRRIGIDFELRRQSEHFDWRGRDHHWIRLPCPGIAGDAQLRNAAGVLAAVEALHWRCPVSEAALIQALPELRVPGRCERRGQFVFDVAHNAEAAAVLADFLASLPAVSTTVLVLGMLADKPHRAVFDALRHVTGPVLLLGLPGPRGLTAAALANLLPADARPQCCENAAEALLEARRIAGGDGRIVVTGSFLTVAALREEIDG